MLDLHYDRLVSDGISGWDLWLLANGWGDAVVFFGPSPAPAGKRKELEKLKGLEEKSFGLVASSEWGCRKGGKR